jgi:hypothetical protein
VYVAITRVGGRAMPFVNEHLVARRHRVHRSSVSRGDVGVSDLPARLAFDATLRALRVVCVVCCSPLASGNDGPSDMERTERSERTEQHAWPLSARDSIAMPWMHRVWGQAVAFQQVRFVKRVFCIHSAGPASFDVSRSTVLFALSLGFLRFALSLGFFRLCSPFSAVCCVDARVAVPTYRSSHLRHVFGCRRQWPTSESLASHQATKQFTSDGMYVLRVARNLARQGVGNLSGWLSLPNHVRTFCLLRATKDSVL